jgi:hypothetical protein
VTTNERIEKPNANNFSLKPFGTTYAINADGARYVQQYMFAVLTLKEVDSIVIANPVHKVIFMEHTLVLAVDATSDAQRRAVREWMRYVFTFQTGRW